MNEDLIELAEKLLSLYEQESISHIENVTCHYEYDIEQLGKEIRDLRNEIDGFK